MATLYLDMNLIITGNTTLDEVDTMVENMSSVVSKSLKNSSDVLRRVSYINNEKLNALIILLNHYKIDNIILSGPWKKIYNVYDLKLMLIARGYYLLSNLIKRPLKEIFEKEYYQDQSVETDIIYDVVSNKIEDFYILDNTVKKSNVVKDGINLYEKFNKTYNLYSKHLVELDKYIDEKIPEL